VKLKLIHSGTPTSLVYGQDTELNVMKDCTIGHELVPIVTMNTNGMQHQQQHQHQYHPSAALPEMLDNIPVDMTQYESNESVILSQLDIFQQPPPPSATQQQQQQQMQSMAAPSSSSHQPPPPPPSQMNVQNILTGVYTLQEEPEEAEENTTM